MITIYHHGESDQLIHPLLNMRYNCLFHGCCTIRPYEITDAYLLCTTWDEYNALQKCGYAPNMIRKYRSMNPDLTQ